MRTGPSDIPAPLDEIGCKGGCRMWAELRGVRPPDGIVPRCHTALQH